MYNSSKFKQNKKDLKLKTLGHLKPSLLLLSSGLKSLSCLKVFHQSVETDGIGHQFEFNYWTVYIAVLIVTNAYHRTWRQLRLKRQIVGKKSELKSFPVPPIHVSGIAGIYSNSCWLFF